MVKSTAATITTVVTVIFLSLDALHILIFSFWVRRFEFLPTALVETVANLDITPTAIVSPPYAISTVIFGLQYTNVFWFANGWLKNPM